MTDREAKLLDSLKIQLDIDTISDALYDALLVAFRREMGRRGLDPNDYHYEDWVVIGKAIKHKDDES